MNKIAALLAPLALAFAAQPAAALQSKSEFGGAHGRWTQISSSTTLLEALLKDRRREMSYRMNAALVGNKKSGVLTGELLRFQERTTFGVPSQWVPAFRLQGRYATDERGLVCFEAHVLLAVGPPEMALVIAPLGRIRGVLKPAIERPAGAKSGGIGEIDPTVAPCDAQHDSAQGLQAVSVLPVPVLARGEFLARWELY